MNKFLVAKSPFSARKPFFGHDCRWPARELLSACFKIQAGFLVLVVVLVLVLENGPRFEDDDEDEDDYDSSTAFLKHVLSASLENVREEEKRQQECSDI